MSVEFDCEMKIDGLDKLGDSKRKGYENQVKCAAETPDIRVFSTGDAVVGPMNSRIAIGNLRVVGVCQNKGNLRQALMSDKIKFKSVEINRFAKIQGSKEEKVIQTIVLEKASFMDLSIDDRSNMFSAGLSYEKIQIKDFPVKAEDGTLDGSPIVTSYNRLTGEVNA